MTRFKGEDIQTAWSGAGVALEYEKWSFIAGIGLFVLCLPFCRSKKSFFDVIAARKVMKCLRTLIFLELICLAALFYYYITYGIPIVLNAQISFGNSSYHGNWLYSFPRPTAGVVLIGLGMFGENHPFIRVACMIGCILQVFGDGVSAYQIYDYRHQELYQDAPHTNGYTPNILMGYFMRDIISIGLSTCICVMAAHLTNIVGWCDPQIIHPSLLTGKDYDRYSAMKRSRGERIMMERMGVIEQATPPANWNLKIRTNYTGNDDSNMDTNRRNDGKDDNV